MAELTFYSDAPSKNKRRRLRVQVILGSTTVYTPVDVPEWGASPGESSTYQQLPDFTILGNERTGETAYDGLPIGMPTRAGRKFSVNMSRLKGGDLATLHAGLLDLTPPEATLATVASAPTIPLPPRWQVLAGDAGDAIADFDVIFDGVQVPAKKRDFDIVKSERVGMVFEAVDLGEYVMRQMMSRWVGERTLTGAAESAAAQIFLRLWASGSTLYGEVASPEDNGSLISATGRFVMRTYTHRNHYISAADIATEMYQFLTRQTRDALTPSYWFRSFRAPAPASGGVGIPQDRAEFFAQDHTTANAAGALLTRTEPAFLATIVDTDNSNAVVAGRLSEGDGCRYEEAPTFWDWADLDCKSLGARVEYRQGGDGIEVWFRSPEETGTTFDIEATDILGVEEVVQAEYALAEVSAARASAGAFDAADVVAEGEPHAAAKWSTTTAFEVGSVNGDKEDWRAATPSRSGAFPAYGDRVLAALGLPLGIYDLTYYEANNADVDATRTTSIDMIFAAHHKVRLLDDGATGPDYDTTTDTLPVGNYLNLVSQGARPTAAITIQAQLEASVGGALTQDVLARYGSPDVTRLKLRLRAASVPGIVLGDGLRLVPAVSGEYLGRYLFGPAGDTTLDSVPGIGVVTAVEPDELAGEVAVTALMLRKT